jgi:hypothetical protein
VAERPADQAAADGAKDRTLTARPRLGPVTGVTVVVMIVIARRRRLGLGAIGHGADQQG